MAENETSNKEEMEELLSLATTRYRVCVVELTPYIRRVLGSQEWALDYRNRTLYSQEVDSLNVAGVIDAVNQRKDRDGHDRDM